MQVLVDQLVDKHNIWCIVIGLFMGPITKPAPASHNPVQVRTYRSLILHPITLCLIILTGVTGPVFFINFVGQDPAGQDSEISQNFEGYYPGVMGLYRLAKTRGSWTGYETRLPPWQLGRDR